MKYDISIIVPVYNGQAYLERCVESVVSAAKGFNVELVVVDDGSIDQSAEVALRYCEMFPWVKYYYQENKGPSSARNAGIDLAQGKYTGFIDCDDCISEDYFSELLSACSSDVDIVVFGYKKIFKNGEAKTFSPNSRRHYEAKDELLCNVTGDKELFWFSWTKLFRTELITNIRFDESMRLGEDTIFNMRAVKKAKSIVRISSVLYSYYEVSGSLSSNSYKSGLLENMEKHFLSRLAVHDSVSGEVEGIPIPWKDIYQYYVFHILPWLISNLKFHDKPYQAAELKKIRDSVFVVTCYSKRFSLGKSPRMILIQLMFRARLFRLLGVFLSMLSGGMRNHTL